MKTLMDHSRTEAADGLHPIVLKRAGPLPAPSVPVGSGLARIFLAGLAAAQILCSGARAAQATNTVQALSLDTFKLVVQRNIFDHNRRPGNVARVRVERKEPKIESFSLVGTLLHEDGIYAFFDGTGSDYRKVYQPGEAIAGYKITEVAVNSVKLEGGDAPVDLPIGMQMRRQDEGKWQLLLGAVPSSASAADSSSESHDRGSDSARRDRGSIGRGAPPDRGTFGRRDRGADSTRRDRGAVAPEPSQVVADVKPSAESDSGASTEEILQRLMKKREKELNK